MLKRPTVTPAPKPLFVTVEDASTLLGGVPIKTLRQWITERRIETFRPGRRVLLEIEPLLKFVRATSRAAVGK